MKGILYPLSILTFMLSCTSNLELDEIGDEKAIRSHTIKFNERNKDLLDYLILQDKDDLFKYLEDEQSENKKLFTAEIFELLKKLETNLPLKRLAVSTLKFHTRLFPSIKISSISSSDDASAEIENQIIPFIRYALLSYYIVNNLIEIDPNNPSNNNNIGQIRIALTCLLKKIHLETMNISHREKKREIGIFNKFMNNSEYSFLIQNLLGVANLEKSLKNAEKFCSKYTTSECKVLNFSNAYWSAKKKYY